MRNWNLPSPFLRFGRRSHCVRGRGERRTGQRSETPARRQTSICQFLGSRGWGSVLPSSCSGTSRDTAPSGSPGSRRWRHGGNNILGLLILFLVLLRLGFGTGQGRDQGGEGQGRAQGLAKEGAPAQARLGGIGQGGRLLVHRSSFMQGCILRPDQTRTAWQVQILLHVQILLQEQ